MLINSVIKKVKCRIFINFKRLIYLNLLPLFISTDRIRTLFNWTFKNQHVVRYLVVILLLVTSLGYGQLTMDIAQDSAVKKYHIGSYSYHEQFKGHKGYGAPLILTADGGGAAFGDGDNGAMLVKLDKNGREQWKRTILAKGDEMESQSVVQDKNGNYFVFILVYDNSKYRGGCERAVFLNKTGTIVWDKFIGSCYLVNNPTVAYMRALNDGRIALRGQVVTQSPPKGVDPNYLFWEGWINSKGTLTQKTGQVIDWKNQDWQKLFKPE